MVRLPSKKKKKKKKKNPDLSTHFFLACYRKHSFFFWPKDNMSLVFMTLFIINNLTLNWKKGQKQSLLCMIHSLYKILNAFVRHSLIKAKI